MRLFSSFLKRLRSLPARKRLDQDLEDELAAHLTLKQHYYEKQGVPGPEAERQAHLALGNATQWKETLAAEWTFPQLESLWRDVAFGSRLLLKDKLFTAVALLTLTAGIGANTAVFSLLNSFLWKSLPVSVPEQLVRIQVVNLPPTEKAWINGRATTPKQRTRMPFALSSLLEKQGLFQGVFGIAGNGAFVADVAGTPYKLQASTVTGAYFPVLGIEPVAGRLLLPSDDVPGGPPSGWGVVISDAAWARLFDRRADAIGSRIIVERVPFTILGVAPRHFQGVSPGVDTDLWLPLSSFETMFPKWQWRSDPGNWMLETMARLKPGVDVAQARDGLAALSTSLLRELKPATLGGIDEKHYFAMKFDLRPASSGYSFLVEAFGPALWTLMAAVSAVLFIAALNLANLVLARSTARSQELAVRLALGASAGRVRRQLLIESAILAVVGAAAGIVAARWIAAALVLAASDPARPIQLDTTVDWRVLAFAAAVLTIVVLVAACVPAWSAVRVSISDAARRGSTRLGARVRGALVVAQIGLTLALLGGAGLLIASMRSVFGEATGFDSHSVFITADLFNAGVTRDRMPRAYESIVAETRRLPGVRGAAWTLHVPLTGGLQAFTIELPGRPDIQLQQRMVFSHQVTDGYFAAAGIPLIAGRDFLPRGAGGPKGSVVSRNLALKFFGSPEAAIGQRLKPGNLDWTEIVGVAADAKFQDVREPNPLTVYTSYWDQQTTLGMTLVVNHSGSSGPLLAAVNALLRKECGRMPFTSVTSVPENISQTLAAERLLTGLLTAFAVFALLISGIGIVGLLGYTVQLKRRDIGVRVALGASPGKIAAEVERLGLRLALLGIGLGAALSWSLRRFIDAHLYRVHADDAAIWTVVCVLLLAFALGISAIPAWRAARLDPMTVLRLE